MSLCQYKRFDSWNNFSFTNVCHINELNVCHTMQGPSVIVSAWQTMKKTSSVWSTFWHHGITHIRYVIHRSGQKSLLQPDKWWRKLLASGAQSDVMKWNICHTTHRTNVIVITWQNEGNFYLLEHILMTMYKTSRVTYWRRNLTSNVIFPLVNQSSKNHDVLSQCIPITK